MILVILTAVLFLLIFVICGDKGSKSIVSTCINALAMVGALFLIYRSFNPLLVIGLTSVLITAVTLFYQNEPNVKSLAAFFSVVVTVLVLLGVIFFMADKANAQGFNAEQYEITDSNGYTRNIHMNMLQLQIATMIIALLGTVIDTAVAVTASAYEIYQNNRALSLQDLFRSSFQVSKAVMSTSIHTIFYVYIAEYLTLLMQYVSDYSFSYIINSQSLASEFISVSISGMGCCLVVPIATVIGAAMIRADHAGGSGADGSGVDGKAAGTSSGSVDASTGGAVRAPAAQFHDGSAAPAARDDGILGGGGFSAAAGGARHAVKSAMGRKNGRAADAEDGGMHHTVFPRRMRNLLPVITVSCARAALPLFLLFAFCATGKNFREFFVDFAENASDRKPTAFLKLDPRALFTNAAAGRRMR